MRTSLPPIHQSRPAPNVDPSTSSRPSLHSPSLSHLPLSPVYCRMFRAEKSREKERRRMRRKERGASEAALRNPRTPTDLEIERARVRCRCASRQSSSLSLRSYNPLSPTLTHLLPVRRLRTPPPPARAPILSLCTGSVCLSVWAAGLALFAR